MMSKASSSFSSLVILAFIAILGLLASAPSTASAGCTLECTALTAKITVCGSVFNGITDELPRIGVDARRDDCLCKQSIIKDLNSCYVCKNPQTVSNITNQFINDCKILSNKNLINGAVGSTSASKGALLGAIALASAVAMILLA
ncbi:hypothetical protein BGZ73_008562 [Actinomortierella ambigua]|nr:hypothetical protein BGZ73_008562 [Actinomortierella ambigua]